MMFEQTIYPDLLLATEFTYSWREDRSFDLTTLDKNEKAAIENFVGIEIEFGASHGRTEKLHQIKNDQIVLLQSFLSKLSWHTKLVHSENYSQQPNRMRTHKGLFKQIPALGNSSYTEFEIEVSQGYTLQYGTLSVDGDNFRFCVDNFLFGVSNDFFLCSRNENIKCENTLRELVQKCIFKNSLVINYARVVSTLLGQNTFLIRAGGDGGDASNSFQFIVHKDILSLIEVLFDSFKK